MRDIDDVGPMATCRAVLRRANNNPPARQQYTPYCGGNPARDAYASDSGITKNANVMPATRSKRNSDLLYDGHH
jgi:hypothetical protein